MGSADQTAHNWDSAAEAYEAAITPLTSLYAEEALRMAEAGGGDRVLDVAAGAGAATMVAAHLGAEVVATDFAPEMVERLRRRVAAEGLGGVRAEVMDGQALDFPDESFDVVVSVFGLIFFPDRARGFSEMQRVLRPGGRAVVTAWSQPDRVPLVSEWGEAARRAIPDLPPPVEDPPVFSLKDPARFRREMEDAGFRDVRVAPLTKAFTPGTPERYFDTFLPASPVFSQMMAGRLDRLPDVRRAFVDLLRERYGDDVRMENEALLGLGRK